MQIYRNVYIKKQFYICIHTQTLCSVLWLEEKKLDPYTKDMLPMLEGRTIIDAATKENDNVIKCLPEVRGSVRIVPPFLLPYNLATSGLRTDSVNVHPSNSSSTPISRKSFIFLFHSACQSQQCSMVQQIGMASYYL